MLSSSKGGAVLKVGNPCAIFIYSCPTLLSRCLLILPPTLPIFLFIMLVYFIQFLLSLPPAGLLPLPYFAAFYFRPAAPPSPPPVVTFVVLFYFLSYCSILSLLLHFLLIQMTHVYFYSSTYSSTVCWFSPALLLPHSTIPTLRLDR